MAGRDNHDDEPSSDPAKQRIQSAAPQADEAFAVIAMRAPHGDSGQIEALLRLLHLKTAAAVLIANHAGDAVRSYSALAEAAGRPVLAAGDGLRLEPGHVYIVEPHRGVTFVKGVFKALPRRRKSTDLQTAQDVEQALRRHFGDRLLQIVLPQPPDEHGLGGDDGAVLWTVGDAARRRRRDGDAPCILLVEENEPMRDLLVIGLVRAGYHVAATGTAQDAGRLLRRGTFLPDLILADPSSSESTIVKAAGKGRQERVEPAEPGPYEGLLNGRGSENKRSARRLHKPLRVKEIIRAIDELLPPHRADPHSQEPSPSAKEDERRHILKDTKPGFAEIIVGNQRLSSRLLALLVRHGWSVLVHKSDEDFVKRHDPRRASCLFLFDESLGTDSGERLRRLRSVRAACPVVVLVRGDDIHAVVEAMRAGAEDVLPLSASDDEILRVASRAIEHAREDAERQGRNSSAQSVLQQLTQRQREILDRIIRGEQNKVIAAALGLSQRTVENHRATIMRKTGSTSLPALLRLVMLAED